jgi:hypothetical protein
VRVNTTTSSVEQDERAARLCVACAATDAPESVERAFWLAFSIRQFGQAMATCPVVAWVAAGSNPSGTSDLEALGVTVREVESHAQKLRMLENLGPECDVLLVLDCDLLVMGDVRPLVSTQALGAMVDWDAGLTDEQWRSIQVGLGLHFEKTALDPLRGRPAWPYFHIGVLTVPRALARQLLVAWNDALGALHSLFEEDPALAAVKNDAEQIALALAVRAASIPVVPLPPSLNCDTGGFPDGLAAPLEAPFVLRYGNNVDSRGLLRRSGNRVVDREIHRFNLARAAEERLGYTRPSRRPLALWMTKRSPRTRRLIRLALALETSAGTRHRAMEVAP